MIDFEIPEHVRMVRDTVRRFVREHLLPLEREVEYDDEKIPESRHRQLMGMVRELGLRGLQRPVEQGGPGFGQRDMVVVHEEAARSLIGKDLWNSGGVPRELYRLPEDVRQRFVEKAERDELRTCLALTEASSGSDPASMQSYFVRDGDNYVINGHKMFITGAHRADYARVFAREKGTSGRQGIAAFLVDTANPGFKVVRVIPTMGRPSSVGTDACELILDDCVVPAYARLTQEGDGWSMVQGALGGVRFAMGARSVAYAQRCLEMATEYSKHRVTFGEPLASRQAVQFMLADSYVEIQATRMLTYHGAWKLDQGLDARQEISVVKVFATEMLGRVADRAIQVHGGIGISKDLPLEKIYRDARLDRIVDGPNEVHRWVIARNLLRDGVAF
jgi:acyl-CoA dehydrogenase